MLRRCRKCGKDKYIHEFAPDKRYRLGTGQLCTKCTRKPGKEPGWIRKTADITAYNRAWRGANRELWREYKRKHYAKNPDRARAKSAMRYALLTGKVVRGEACLACGETENIHGHHPDYSQPLSVVWLCNQCHIDAHHISRTDSGGSK